MSLVDVVRSISASRRAVIHRSAHHPPFLVPIFFMDVATDQLLACPCLNVQLRVRPASPTDALELRAAPPMKIRDGFNAERPFVARGGVNKDSTRAPSWIKAAVPALVSCFQSEEEAWGVIWCLLCETTVATVFQSSISVIASTLNFSPTCTPPPSVAPMSSCPAPSTTLFISDKLLNADQMDAVRADADFSEAINVVLPPIDEDATPMDESELSKTLAQCTGGQQVQTVCTSFLRSQQERMDERIRTYIQQQQDQFERVRVRTKTERDRILRVLQEKATPENVLSQSRVERQRSGGEDSAVPLSPVSITSLGDPSPALHQPPSPLLKTSVESSQQSAFGRPSPMNGTMRGATTPVLSAVPVDDNAELAEDALFSLDEDHDTVLTRTSAFLPADDEAETDDSGTGEDYYYAGNSVLHQKQQHQQQGAVPPSIKPIRAAAPGAGMLASKFGTSLPVTIPGRFWPPKDAKDSFVPEGDESSDDDYEPRQKTVFPQRVSKDMYQDMRAQARSIQAADDPERLFGERPQRRRYRTGDVVRMRATVGNATVTTGGTNAVIVPGAALACDRS